MFVFALIVSILLAFIRYDSKQEIIRYALKLFIYMTCGVIVFAWFMHFF